eukprot:CAMPEP_0179421258 /NCGR_PEP_ID=MMETSP0799-20121207/9657_1 /TAXON_ID=46947 /ORGANISM="Geminigera cryophila, Strain CCMP2564" /LENGTH=75 /DNA_ID=CAMNT_0021195027 /DNA_START=1865 /DNA_END=2092 /DNA_ORIENTATION=-
MRTSAVNSSSDSPRCDDDIAAIEVPAMRADVMSSGPPMIDVDDTSTHVCESLFWKSKPIELVGMSKAPNALLSLN